MTEPSWTCAVSAFIAGRMANRIPTATRDPLNSTRYFAGANPSGKPQEKPCGFILLKSDTI